MSQIATFLSEYWVVILVLVILVVVLAAIRAVRKVMKEGGGAFNMETIRKNSEPNREVIRYKGKAMLRDADVVCEVKGNRVVPKREDLSLFRAAFKSKFKAAVFLVEKENKVAYFFCKTEAGLQRRITNLMLDKQEKNSHWPYTDKATGEHLRFPRV